LNSLIVAEWDTTSSTSFTTSNTSSPSSSGFTGPIGNVVSLVYIELFAMQLKSDQNTRARYRRPNIAEFAEIADKNLRNFTILSSNTITANIAEHAQYRRIFQKFLLQISGSRFVEYLVLRISVIHFI
jgi:hypothetical protein